MKEPYLVRAILKARTRTPPLTRSSCSSPSASLASNTGLKIVTKSNFVPVLAELRRHVKEADFVSVDLEMTGLTSAPWRESFEFDQADIQYLKVKDSAKKFAIVQFGCVPFAGTLMATPSSLVSTTFTYFLGRELQVNVHLLSSCARHPRWNSWQNTSLISMHVYMKIFNLDKEQQLYFTAALPELEVQLLILFKKTKRRKH